MCALRKCQLLIWKTRESNDKDYIVINQSPIEPAFHGKEKRKLTGFFIRSYFLCCSLAGAREQSGNPPEAVSSHSESELTIWSLQIRSGSEHVPFFISTEIAPCHVVIKHREANPD